MEGLYYYFMEYKIRCLLIKKKHSIHSPKKPMSYFCCFISLVRAIIIKAYEKAFQLPNAVERTYSKIERFINGVN